MTELELRLALLERAMVRLMARVKALEQEIEEAIGERT
jgi:chaperonin cofactor prefoldin